MRDLAPFLKRRQDGRPRIMGVVNVTPDSFHAESRAEVVDTAVSRGLAMWDAGADWIDIGGESTRPNAEPVSAEVEAERVIPVISALRAERPHGLISIDTRKPSVAEQALQAGSDMVNDVSGLRNPQMFELVANRNCAVCIMHMAGEPANMQDEPTYDDVVGEVSEALLGTAERLVSAGKNGDLIAIDPGIGFGKTLAHNLSLLRSLKRLRGEHNFSVLWGVSRKSMFRSLLGRESSDERLAGTLAVAAHGMTEGVDILRVHDVAEHQDLLLTLAALK